jgi:hypothetical protein
MVLLRTHPALEPRTWPRTTHHVIDDAHCLSDRRCLESHGCIAADKFLDGDAARCILVEVDALHLARAFRDRCRWLEDSICGAGRGRAVLSGRHDARRQIAKEMSRAQGPGRIYGIFSRHLVFRRAISGFFCNGCLPCCACRFLKPPHVKR